MRISDWSSDVCSSDLTAYGDRVELTDTLRDAVVDNILLVLERGGRIAARSGSRTDGRTVLSHAVYSPCDVVNSDGCPTTPLWQVKAVERSEEHTSELQSLMRISYAVFCLKKKKTY